VRVLLSSQGAFPQENSGFSRVDYALFDGRLSKSAAAYPCGIARQSQQSLVGESTAKPYAYPSHGLVPRIGIRGETRSLSANQPAAYLGQLHVPGGGSQADLHCAHLPNPLRLLKRVAWIGP
jgi:hypothetical protein